MLTYVIISGIILAAIVNYQMYLKSDSVSLLEVIAMSLTSMILGWVMLPLLLIISLDKIKL